MRIVRTAFALVCVWGASLLLAQVPAAAASSEPLIVDVHASPYRPTISYTTNISSQRYDLRHATILNIIELAYKVGGPYDDDRAPDAILGGPTWIDFDRFDVVARIPSLKAVKPAAAASGPTETANAQDNPYDKISPVLKRVLEERFHLTYHMEERPLPGYVVTLAGGGAKMADAKAPDAPTNCHYEQDKANPMQYTVACTSETVTQLLATFGGAFPHPIIDRTGLKKAYDFTLKMSMGGPEIHTRDDMARVYMEAFGKQLGLAIAPGDVPQPALVVDTVERPTANVAEMVKQIPPLPDLEFEVASIRPAADTEPRDSMRQNGSQITFSAFNLQGLLTRAWQLPTGAMLGDALPLLPPARWTILVKLPPEVDARAIYQDPDEIANMLQKLLMDRFQVKSHWGEWTPPDATVLLGGTPKMKKADPKSRSFCKFGPAEGEKTMRTAGSPYDREFHCQNVTMAQFADLMQPLASSDVKTRVPDRTGLAGAWDFTVYYTAARTLRAQMTAAAEEAKKDGEATAAPTAGLALADAFKKELGLRIERQSVTLPALVLDHFAQAPSEN